jgi:hypothetical protein
MALKKLQSSNWPDTPSTSPIDAVLKKQRFIVLRRHSDHSICMYVVVACDELFILIIVPDQFIHTMGEGLLGTLVIGHIPRFS